MAAKYELTHTLHLVGAAYGKAARAVDAARVRILSVIGTQLLSWAWQDYTAKSRGQADGAGNTWEKITKGAIRTRLLGRRGGEYAKLSAEAAHKAEQKKPLKAELARRLPAGSDATLRRQAIFHDWVAHTESGRKFAQLTDEIQKARAKQRALVDTEHAAAAIGIDTGRLRTSLDFAARSPDTLFAVDGVSVTVGSRLEYAAAFAAARPIFPDNFVTAPRRQALERMTERALERIIAEQTGDAIRGGTGT